MNLSFFTLAPSPHITGLLDTLSSDDRVALRVVYERKWLSDRRWGLHLGEAPHVFLESVDLWGYGQLCGPHIVAELHHHPPDLAIVNTSYVSLNTYLLIYLLQQADIPFVFWAERPSRLSRPAVKIARQPLLRWILNRAAGFVGSTRATVDFYRQVLGYCGSGTHIPYHRSLDPFLELPLCGESPSRPKFLLLGTLSHGKGIDTILRALARLTEPVQLQVVGKGPYEPELRQLAERTGYRHEVSFTGEVAYEAVPSVLAAADVLLFPSRHDGFGMVTMEALAAGVPVMASTAVMSALEYIKPGYNGWLLPVDDEHAWAAQLQQVMETPQQVLPMARAARATIGEAYDVQRDAARLLSFLNAGLRHPMQHT